LLGVSVTIEVLGASPERVDLHPELLGVLANVDGDIETLGDGGRFVDRVIDPALPRSGSVDEDELSVVEADADDHRLRPLPLIDEMSGGTHRLEVVLSLVGPCSRHRRGA
jgi:hypothetical protein